MGQRFEPCGTPHLITFGDDFLPLIEEMCFLKPIQTNCAP